MKKLYGSFAAKLIAVILLCALVLVFGASVVGAGLNYSWGAYTSDYRSFLGNMIGDRAQSRLYGIGRNYLSGVDPEDLLNDEYLRIRILNNKGEELYSNYEGEKALWEGSATVGPDFNLESKDNGENVNLYEETEDGYNMAKPTPEPTVTPSETAQKEKNTWVAYNYDSGESREFESQEEAWGWIQEGCITVKGYVTEALVNEGAFRQQADWAGFLYTGRFALLWIAGLSFLAGVLVFIYLLCAAGHRKNSEEIVPSFVEKIPFDMFTVLIVAAIAVCLLPTMGDWDWPESLVILIPCVLGMGLLFLLWCMSFAVRVKLGNLWSGCLFVRLLRLLGKGIRLLPLLWKWAVGIGALAMIDLLWRVSNIWSENREAFGWVLFWLLVGPGTLYAVYSFRKLRKGAKEIASGNLSYTVDDKYLLWDLKDHANDLNHIRDGMNNAVEERVKSERFRTELITNVSHDIKTPLTSIVNYVDLLAKEEPESETQREYLEVLQRQSGKLKKLIEDLIEASKASTGSLPVSLERVDLGVLLDQTAGEYSERLENAQLELVAQKPEQPVNVMADGRHLWRVFDNLMNNVVKYAQPGTRVYLNLSSENGKATVIFRNISREALNLNAKELSERFVRGDSSRSTEGSGLGLSIAMSLMKLQKGSMDITVDGDLFKVTLGFDTV